MYQHQQLLNKAKSLGIAIQDVSDLMQQPTAILTYNGMTELVMDGVPTSWINARGQFYCDNKQLTKLAYQELDIAYPKSITFQTPDDERLPVFFKNNQTYVCKPLDATNGVGVVLGIENMEMVRAYYEQYKHLDTLFLLEELAAGEDLRIHVIKGKIVAAVIREPAFILGNGKDTLDTLIENRRAVMKTQNPNNFLVIDENTQQLIAAQHLTLQSIPQDGQKVKLKYISNMAQGGVAIDVTDEIHPGFQDWITKLSEYLNSSYFGLDLMTTNHTKQPSQHSKVLEINARADWLHHTFSEHRTHDMADMILNAVFNL
jgi:cyanophycin synthetase